MRVEQKIEAMGLALPEPLAEQGVRLPFANVRVRGNRAYISGHGPLNPDGSLWQPMGKVGAELTLEQGYEAAKLTMLNLLESLQKCIGDLDKVTQVVKLLGLVNSTLDYTEQPAVINGATELLIELYGDAGRHARSAVGMAQLPGGMAVEIEMIVEVAD